MPISQVAEIGFTAADLYDTHRPDYPAEAVTKFLQVLEIRNVPGARIIDLAAGTGKFTEVLAAQPENFDIIAVEPHASMRSQLVKKNLKNVQVIEGSAEDMNMIESSSVAALIAAQSFHWFSNMNALKEIHRVLQPTGVLGMIWNVEDYKAPKDWKIHTGWQTVMRDEMFALDDGLPRFRNAQWKQIFDEQNKGNPLSIHAADPLFGLPIGEASLDVVPRMSKEAVWNRIKTDSLIANLEPTRREAVEKRFWDAINDPQTEVDSEGRVLVHRKVVWAWASKIPTEPLQSGGNPNA